MDQPTSEPVPDRDDVPLDPDDVEIELEPTVLTHSAGRLSPGGVVLHAPSLKGEIDALRRRRLGAAAWFLAALYLLMVVGRLVVTDPALEVSTRLIAYRLLLAGAVAVALSSRVPLAPEMVRSLEYLLFGGITLLLTTSQYQVHLQLIRSGDAASMMAVEKDGILQLFVLMTLYGMFIPNDAASAARVVLTMALVPFFTLAVLLERPEAARVVHRLGTIEHSGTNALLLLVGASLAIYGAHVLHGLRAELHLARRFGQYRLVRRLGVGGMGEVYLAEHQWLKRPCALKLIRPEAVDDPIALARFEREVQSAARLDHPNIIAIFDYGHTDDGTFYYVMEYLRGMSLAELLSRFGPLPPGRVVYLLRQVCAGLAEAHRIGMVHRDLKPGNLFAAVRGGEADVAKVLDFGLVKLTRDSGATELTGDHTISGTPVFMAPEQATDEPTLDARADIYALGAIGYCLLTGRPPFQGDSPMAIMIAHARDPVVPPSRLRPDLPADLEQVVLRCLEKRPDDRYPDAKSLARALAACGSAADWDAERAAQWWATTPIPSPEALAEA